MIKQLIELANKLDSKGYKKEASALDQILISNKAELKRYAGIQVSDEEARSHEMHSPSEELPGFAEHEMAQEYKASLDVDEFADILVRGIGIFGKDPDTGKAVEEDVKKELVELLSPPRHAATITAVLDHISPSASWPGKEEDKEGDLDQIPY